MSRVTAVPMKHGGNISNGAVGSGADPTRRRVTTPGRVTKRNLPLVGLGVLLVVGCAIGFSSAWLRAGGRQDVLVMTKSLAAGQVLAPSDLGTARISVASGIASVPSAELSQVIGRPVASALMSGTLLTESDVAQSVGPPRGRAVVGLALKPGQYPPDIAAGERVLVVVDGADSTTSGSSAPSGSSATSGSTAADTPVEATVIGVEPSVANSESLVVTVQLAEGNGTSVASAASGGNVALAIISSGATS